MGTERGTTLPGLGPAGRTGGSGCSTSSRCWGEGGQGDWEPHCQGHCKPHRGPRTSPSRPCSPQLTASGSTGELVKRQISSPWVWVRLPGAAAAAAGRGPTVSGEAPAPGKSPWSSTAGHRNAPIPAVSWGLHVTSGQSLKGSVTEGGLQ